MNLLENIAIEMTCPSCGVRYRVSLDLVARAHHALHAGCPVADAHVRECPQATFAKLASEGALDELVRAWARVEHEIASSGAGIVISSESIAPGDAAHEGPPSERELDEALEESFPASDPPFWTSGWSRSDVAPSPPPPDEQHDEE